MKLVNIRQLTLCAVFAALIAVSTLFLKIPGVTGYYHLGDGIIYACAIMLGPVSGMLAGGVGSVAADIVGGHFQWVPWTFVIKSLTGLVVGLLAVRGKWARNIAAMVVGSLVTIIGYAVGTYVYYGWAAVTAEVYGNLGQTGSGIIVATILTYVLARRMPQNSRFSG